MCSDQKASLNFHLLALPSLPLVQPSQAATKSPSLSRQGSAMDLKHALILQRSILELNRLRESTSKVM